MTAAILLLAGVVGSAGGAPPLADPFPRAGAAYLVAIDGTPRWAHDADAARAPASLTKLMTAIVLLRSGWDPDDWITVSPRAARETGARARLRAGEQLRARDALAAMLVASPNDVCLALAEHAAGSAQRFVARMNEEVRAMGLAGTRFTDPCGHDAPGQRSTARDLWRIATAALARPDIRAAAALRSFEVRTRAGRTLTLATTNMLLGRVEGVTGLKTGFTRQAGRCLVVSARRGGTEIVVVLLGAAEGWPDRWWASAALVEAAFGEAARG